GGGRRGGWGRSRRGGRRGGAGRIGWGWGKSRRITTLPCSNIAAAETMTPILDNKHPSAPSVFQPRALLREARRQKRLAAADVPAVCVLDPDGDIVRRLRATGRARPFEAW